MRLGSTGGSTYGVWALLFTTRRDPRRNIALAHSVARVRATMPITAPQLRCVRLQNPLRKSFFPHRDLCSLSMWQVHLPAAALRISSTSSPALLLKDFDRRAPRFLSCTCCGSSCALLRTVGLMTWAVESTDQSHQHVCCRRLARRLSACYTL